MTHDVYAKIVHPYMLDENGKKSSIEGFKIWFPESLTNEVMHKMYDKFKQPGENKLQFAKRFNVQWERRMIRIPEVQIRTELIKSLPCSYTENMDGFEPYKKQ